MEKVLNELLIKINYIMTYLYISETQNIMDIYQEDQKKILDDQVKKQPKRMTNKKLKEVITHAYKTNNFKVDLDSNQYVVTYEDREYRFSKDEWFRGIINV